MPHLAMPIATYHKSGWSYDTIKFIAGISIINTDGVSPRDVFFQLNSRAGDEMTHNSPKDERTNKDAFILNYHPDFKNFSLEQRIIKYYSMSNLDKQREKLYKATIDVKEKETKRFSKMFVKGSKWAVGGFLMSFLFFLYRTKRNGPWGGMWAREDMSPKSTGMSNIIGIISRYNSSNIPRSVYKKTEKLNKPKLKPKVTAKPKVKPKKPKVGVVYKGSVIELAKKDLKTTTKRKTLKKKVTSRKKIVKKSKPKFNSRLWRWR